MKVKVFNNEGKAVKDIVLNPDIFGIDVNPETVRQVVLAMQANKRFNFAHAKDRSEVRGGGAKPWKQKGTGRARHGSRRSPLWIGGGVTFGPSKDRNFSQKINKKMKRTALFMVLSDRAVDNSLKIIDKLDLTEYKTKKILEIMKNFEIEKSLLIVTDNFNSELIKSVSNIPKIDVIEARNINILEVIKYKDILVTENGLSVIDETFLSKKVVKKAPASEKKETVKEEVKTEAKEAKEVTKSK